jgi:hypothetical protein
LGRGTGEKHMIENVYEYSFDEISNLREINFGILEMYHPHIREDVVIASDDLSFVLEKVKQGWQIRNSKKGVLLRSPEVWLADLTDPFKITRNGGIVENYAIYSFLRSKIQSNQFREFMDEILDNNQFSGLNTCLLNGESLDLQIRLAGSDSRVFDFRNALVRKIKTDKVWEETVKYTCDYLGADRKINVKSCSISEMGKTGADFYLLLKEFHKLNFPTFPYFEIKECYTVIWDKIPEADYYLFIPKSGFKYALGFVDFHKRFDHVFFYEYHAQNTVYEDSVLFEKDVSNKRVAIIDESYSGNSLSCVAGIMKAKGGVPLTIALFPKSYLAIQKSDYCIVIDKLLPSSAIADGENWDRQLYRKAAAIDE